MRAPSLQLLRALRASEPLPNTCPSQWRSFHGRSTARPRTCKQPEQLVFRAQISSTKAPWQASHNKLADRGPVSNEDTQTDFGSMNVLGNTPPPTTSIDACLTDGFHLDNGLKIGCGSGCILLAGEAFSWRPWELMGKGPSSRGKMINGKGQWAVENEAWGILDLVWPKPDLLILGLGASTYPISPETRRYINSLGMKVEIQDTRNAAAQFNLLATERGVSSIAAALIPIGWKGT